MTDVFYDSFARCTVHLNPQPCPVCAYMNQSAEGTPTEPIEPPKPDPKVEPTPKGVTPRKEWDRNRLTNLLNASRRYSEANLPIPTEWLDEIKELSGL